MNFWQTLLSWFASFFTELKQSQAPSVASVPASSPITSAPAPATAVPIVPSAPTMADKVATLIAQYNGPMGPSPTTGGIIHKTTPAQNARTAALIVEYAKPPSFPVSLFLAWVMAESLGDPGALNPNKNIAKPGETAEQTFLHSDIGIAQIDGAELVAMPEFAGVAWQDIQATAFDPSWAIPMMAEICLGLIAWANDKQTTSGSDPEWGLDPYVLACSAYNLGRTGSLRVGASYAYGQGVVARWKSYAAVLGA